MLGMRLFSDVLQVWRISVVKKWIAGSVSLKVPAANVSLRPRSLAANARLRDVVRCGRSWLTSVFACKSLRETFVGGRDVLHHPSAVNVRPGLGTIHVDRPEGA
jgi:hypothetical protein